MELEIMLVGKMVEVEVVIALLVGVLILRHLFQVLLVPV